MNLAIDTLAESARLAPSGDNTQPWTFAVSHSENRLTIESDPSRDPSPMNAGDRMSRIAIGAAIENVIQTARANNWELDVRYSDSTVDVSLHTASDGTDLEPAIRDRVSNRREYQGTKIPEETIRQMKRAVSAEGGVSARWIVSPDDRARLTRLIGDADALMLSNESIRKAFLDKVRFDQPVNAEVDEGLSLGSLEVSAFQRVALRMMQWIPDHVLQIGGAKRTFRQAASRLASSASGFCVVCGEDTDARSDYGVGQVFQRAWLELTRNDLAVQPMMSLLVLQNIRDNGTELLKQQLGVEGVSNLLDRFNESISLEPGTFPRAMLRFGYAEPPTSRTGRLRF